MHEDTFALRVTFTRRLFCTDGFLMHKRLFLHESKKVHKVKQEKKVTD